MDSAAMNACMADYFSAEKFESIIFILIGATAILASALIFYRWESYRGMIVPLAAIALIQLVVGGAIFMRTDAQVADLALRLQADTAAYRAAELARMEAVARGFGYYKAAEIALLAAGIIIALIFRTSDFVYALGIGLIIQPGIMLVMDLVAEKRAEEYIRRLMDFL